MGCTVLVVCLYEFFTQGATYFHSVAKKVVVRTLGSSKYKKREIK